MNYLCPVCGYNQLRHPPKNYHICPCCGTEFGHDDLDETPQMLQDEWIARGMQWFSQTTQPPAHWSPAAQLRAAGFGYDLTASRETETAIPV